MTKTKIYKIEGMSCTGCANNIEENLKKLDDVDKVSVDFNSQSLTVTGHADEETIENVIASLGYGITK